MRAKQWATYSCSSEVWPQSRARLSGQASLRSMWKALLLVLPRGSTHLWMGCKMGLPWDSNKGQLARRGRWLAAAPGTRSSRGTLLGFLDAAPRCPSGSDHGSIRELNIAPVMLYHILLIIDRGPSGSTLGSTLKVNLVLALLAQGMWIKFLLSTRC